MKKPGAPEPLYLAARRVLLDALEALGNQRKAIIVVGAQAIYLHVGEADLAIEPFTTDADIVIDPGKLNPDPHLDTTMKSAGFKPGVQPGEWLATTTADGSKVNISVDLMVPDSIGGVGRRGARLGVHGDKTARKARGLEAALTDHLIMEIASLEAGDARTYSVPVASPSALLVAKLFKIGERADTPSRSSNKDGLDVFRLLRGVSTEELAQGMSRSLKDKFSHDVSQQAMVYLQDLFANKNGMGLQLAIDAAAGLMSEDEVRESCAFLAQSLLQSLNKQ